jgi:hypothetical protein
MQDQRYSDAELAAYQRGVQDAIAAASWVIDGNTKREAVAYVVGLLDAGDPAADDYLPARPNLSGEWADELTPGRLFEEVTGHDAHAEATFNQDAYQAVLEPICQAYEAGVDDTFSDECERVLRAALETDR